MSGLVRLYPRTWRDRYEVEFLGVLASRPPSLRDRFDIVRGAMDARLHPELPGSTEGSRPKMQPAPLAAAASVSAGVVWLAWLGLVLRDFRGWGTGMPESQALMVALAALMGLAFASAHVFLPMAAQATMRPFGGIAASTAAVSFTLTAFGGGATVAFALLGSTALAAALAGRAVPVPVALAWAASTLLALAAMVAFVNGGGRELGLLPLLLPFGLSWILVGVVVARRGVPSPAPQASTPG